jgi:CRISPR-associated endonuclease Cas1
MIPSARDTMELMALEGRIRESYYQSFNVILNLPEPFQRRERRPPTNPINALISFGNSLLYATTLSEIYRTQLNPTVSFLHEPSARRYSLSLDLSEIFKPIIVDRTIFKVVNERMIQMDDFDRDLNYCYLKESWAQDVRAGVREQTAADDRASQAEEARLVQTLNSPGVLQACEAPGGRGALRGLSHVVVSLLYVVVVYDVDVARVPKVCKFFKEILALGAKFGL